MKKKIVSLCIVSVVLILLWAAAIVGNCFWFKGSAHNWSSLIWYLNNGLGYAKCEGIIAYFVNGDKTALSEMIVNITFWVAVSITVVMCFAWIISAIAFKRAKYIFGALSVAILATPAIAFITCIPEFIFANLSNWSSATWWASFDENVIDSIAKIVFSIAGMICGILSAVLFGIGTTAMRKYPGTKALKVADEEYVEDDEDDEEVEDTVAEEAPVETTPVEEVVVEEAPVVEEVVTEEAPVEEAPVEEAPVAAETVATPVVSEKAVEEAPVAPTPAPTTPTITLTPEELATMIRTIVAEEMAKCAPVAPAPAPAPTPFIANGTPLIVQYFNGVAPAQVTTTTPAPAPAPEAPKPAVAPVAPVVAPTDGEKAKVVRVPFEERIIDGDKELQDNYSELKNEFLSWGLKSRVSSTGDSFRLHTKTYAKITVAGKGLKIYFALDPNDYADSKIPMKDASDKNLYVETPLCMKVKSGLSLRRAKTLIKDACEKDNLTQGEVLSVNWTKEVKAAYKAKKAVKAKKDDEGEDDED